MKDRHWRSTKKYPHRQVKGRRVRCFKEIALDPEKFMFRMTSRNEI